MRFISVFTHAPRNTGPSQEEMTNMGKLVEEGMKAGWLLTTEGVHFGEAGAIIRAKAGKVTVTDGPFTEAKEVIGGYAIMKAKSRAEAIELCRKFLSVAGDGTCEIHELYEMPGKS